MSTERQKRFVAKQHAAGRKRKNVWIHKSRERELEEFVKSLQEPKPKS